MQSEQEFDAVVVGGGLSGLVAGTRAAQAGLRVAIFEKGSEETYLCNSRFTGGFFHVAMDDIFASKEQLLNSISETTKGEAEPELANALVDHASRAVAWLRSLGVRFVRTGVEGWKQAVLTPVALGRPGLHWQGRGGDVLLRDLQNKFVKSGGTFHRGTRVTELVMDNDRCVGVVVAEGNDTRTVKAGAVVLADGGFQADLDRVGKEISPSPKKLLQRGAATGTGDGARMAAKVGAALVKLDSFYGHIQHRKAMGTTDLWPHPVVDTICSAGIVVNDKGMRICDEGEGGVFIANAIAKLDDPLSCTAIFDDAIWDGPAKGYVLGANPHIVDAGGTIEEASSVEELAAKVQIAPAALADTIASYNRAVKGETLGGLVPKRSSAPLAAYPINTAKLRAIPLCVGITYTMGGISVDGSARVLNAQRIPIAGLYAAGSTTGGLEGGSNAGYTGGLSKAVVFGLLAAESIVAAVGKPLPTQKT
jgi:fumarate reductase flavoprotein subunit